MDVTHRKRASIIALRKHTGLSIRNISEKLAIPLSTVGDIIKRAKDTSEQRTLRHGRCGRKRKTTPQHVKVMIRNSVKNPKKTSKDIQRDIALAGVNVAFSTVRRRLLEVGRTARRPLCKQLLTKAMKKKRLLSWARNHAEWTKGDWRKVIFSDQLDFEVHGYKSAVVRRSKREPVRLEYIQQTPKHFPKKMFWGSFTAKGPGRLIIIESMMNSDIYKATLQSHLRSVLKKETLLMVITFSSRI